MASEEEWVGAWELVLRQNHVVEDAVRNVKFTSYRGAIGGSQAEEI